MGGSNPPTMNKTKVEAALKALQEKTNRLKTAADVHAKIGSLLTASGFKAYSELESEIASAIGEPAAPAAVAPAKTAAAPKLKVVPAPKKAPASKEAAAGKEARQRRPRLTQEQRDTIYTLNVQGKTPQEISETTQIPYATVYQTIRRQQTDKKQAAK